MEQFMEKMTSCGAKGMIRWDSDPVLKPYKVPAGIYSPFPGAVSKHALGSVGEYVSPTLVKTLRLYALQCEGKAEEPREVALSIDEEGKSWAEFRYSSDEDETAEDMADVAVFDAASKKMKAAVCQKDGKDITVFTTLFDPRKGLNPGVAVMLALLPNLLADTEFETFYLKGKDALMDPEKADSDFYSAMAVLTSNFISRAEEAKSCFGIRSESSVKIMKQAQVVNAVNTVDSEEGVGEFRFIGTAGFCAGTMTASAFNGKFRIGASVEPDAQTMPDSYLVPQVIIDLCRDIRDSTQQCVPVRNIMLLGPSGTGKSEGAKAIAAGLGIPYEAYTCHSKTDLFEIFGGYVPNTEETKAVNADIPSAEDMEFDPEGSYERLTGSALQEGKKTDLCELFSLAMNKLKKSVSKDSNRFRFVESATTRAIRSDRYRVLEIQELDRIRDAGTITMLNEILCYGKAQLPNGQVIQRGRNTIIVFTANVNYAASRQMDQSVISRCEEVEWIELPDRAELVKRAMVRTGCSDRSLVEKMCSKVMEVRQYCEEQGITDGSCGFRELVSWITTVMMGRSYEKQAVRCVINKATLSDDDKRSIAVACFDTEYDEMLKA